MSPTLVAGAFARRVTLDKYAKPEIERRFRLDRVPPEASDPVEITDRYLEGGHLRLRCVRIPGQPATYKLGHKHRLDPDDPLRRLHTSLYLTEGEHAMLEQLPDVCCERRACGSISMAALRSSMSCMAHTRDWCCWRWGSLPMGTLVRSCLLRRAGPETDLSGGDLA